MKEKPKENEEYLGRAEPADMAELADLRYTDKGWSYLNEDGSFKRRKYLEK